MVGSIGGCFYLSRDILHQKAEAGDAIGYKEGGAAAALFKKSVHLIG